MQHLGYPSKIVNLLQSLYKISKSAVRVDNDLTDWFQTLIGVRQGCILSPQLFNILLELVITTAIEDSNIGLRLNGSIVNNLRFADDIALMAESEADLQTLVDLVHTTSKQFGLTINIGKTEVQVINKEPKPVSISIQGKTLNQVQSFTYLGGVINDDATSSHDIKRRIGLAMGGMQKLSVIWRAKEISLPTKMELYRVLILSITTYGSESWTLKKKDEQRLLTFEMSCLRRITGVSRRDRIKNVTTRAQTNCEISIVQKIQHKQLLYFGHVSRMPNTRLPKNALECNIEGLRPRGRPPKRWLDNIRSSCHDLGLESVCEAKRMTEHRRTWISLVKRLLSPKTPSDSEGGQH